MSAVTPLDNAQRAALHDKHAGMQNPINFSIDINSAPGRVALRSYAYGLIAYGYEEDGRLILKIVGKTDQLDPSPYGGVQ